MQKYSIRRAALLMTLGVTFVLILPLSYVMLVSGIEISGLIRTLQDSFQINEIRKLVDQTIMGLPLSETVREIVDSTLKNNLEGILLTI